MGQSKVFSFVLLLSSVISCASASSNLVLPPPANVTSSLPDVGIVWVQGALVPNDRYVPLMSQLQQICGQSNIRLWVGLPELWLDTPNPITIGPGIDSTLQLMSQQGMPNDTIMFYGAHSLGTVMLQDYLTGQSSKKIAGQILGGGYLLRKKYYPSFSYPIPTLTIGGELDGLARVTRTIAESMYNILNVTSVDSPLPSGSPVSASTFPVIMVPGLNHWQFATGNQTTWVRTHDLVPEISDEDAHEAIATHIADYIQYMATLQSIKSIQNQDRLSEKITPAAKASRKQRDTLSNVSMMMQDAEQRILDAVRSTQAFIAPVITAYLREGSRHYNAKDQYGGDGEKTCSRGLCDGVSEWTEVAQKVIAGDVPGFSNVVVPNLYAKLSSSPVTGGDFHLPRITPDSETSTVTVTTYTQGSWSKLDGTDGGAWYTSASELAAKLASRQCILINATLNSSVPFSVDDPDFCSQTNQMAYEWALSIAGNSTRLRFERLGQPFVFGPDISKIGGPWFIDSALQFNSINLDSGVPAIQVLSPMCKTEVDYWQKHFPFPRPSEIPDPGCYHYCKLLSPARAAEWIYVDGLRVATSNSSQCTSCVEGHDLNKMWCWVDGACHDVNDVNNPCAGPQGQAQCVSGSGCACSSCWDPTCAHANSSFAAVDM